MSMKDKIASGSHWATLVRGNEFRFYKPYISSLIARNSRIIQNHFAQGCIPASIGFRPDLTIPPDNVGYFLATVPRQQQELLVQRLSRQVKIKDLVGLSFPDQRFNVFADMMGAGGVLVEGDTVGFRIRADQDSYILLIDIDPTGSVYVIYPVNEQELSPIKANRELALPDIGKVGRPLGTEYVKVFAFKQRSSALERMIDAEFDPSDEKFSVLMRLVKDQRHAIAQTTLRVKTCGKGDIIKANKR